MERIEYISMANVISTIAVVYIHVASITRKVNLVGFQYGSVIDLIFGFAVPIFFMISGAMLLDFKNRYPLKTYLKKRISKTVIPFLFWSMFGLLFYVYVLKTVNLNNTIQIFKGLFITGDLIPVYWFFIPLFFCYFIIYPIFTKISDNKKLLKYIIIFGLFFYFFANNLLNFNHKICVYIVYTLIGYYIHKFDISRKLKHIIYVLGLGSLFIAFIHVILSSNWSSTFITYYSNASLFCCIYSIFIFVLIKKRLVNLMNHPIINKFIMILNNYIFGIYLIQWYILFILIMLLPFKNLLVYFLVVPIMTILISVFLIYCLRKISVFRIIFP